MGLPKAIQAHGEGNLSLAERHYERALQQKQFKPALFQNYGSLLRSIGKVEQSKEIYLQGLSLYPNHIGILRNYFNFLRGVDENPHKALKYALKAARLSLPEGKDSLESMYCECVDILRECNFFQWSYCLLKQAFRDLGITSKLLWRLFNLSVDDRSVVFTDQQSDQILSLIEERLHHADPLEHAEFLFMKSFYFAKHAKDSFAIDSILKAHAVLKEANFIDKSQRDKAQKLIDINSWNASCLLLKTSRFEEAWKLFEYGLRAPAVGRQRWQRHLKKVFSHLELPLWRGSNLQGSRLLLLEEQAVGDTMMFLSLFPTLVDEASHIGVVLSSRLKPIYERSFSELIRRGQVSIWSHEDVSVGRLRAIDFDFQSPVGSICQYRFTQIDSYAPKAPILIADDQRKLFFKRKDSSLPQKPLRIGLSWRGGGRSDRIKLKSIEEDMVANLMREHSENITYVNLQYGDVTTVLKDWKSHGLPVVNETSVNPLKNMEEWLNLVASCDAVISVANTTIHGAGGLNIPTMCFLSRHSDWRWLGDSRVERSYWYPSVGIARESLEDGWLPALRTVSDWIQAGCPMPDGLVHTHDATSEVYRASVTGVGNQA